MFIVCCWPLTPFRSHLNAINAKTNHQRPFRPPIHEHLRQLDQTVVSSRVEVRGEEDDGIDTLISGTQSSYRHQTINTITNANMNSVHKLSSVSSNLSREKPREAGGHHMTNLFHDWDVKLLPSIFIYLAIGHRLRLIKYVSSLNYNKSNQNKCQRSAFQQTTSTTFEKSQTENSQILYSQVINPHQQVEKLLLFCDTVSNILCTKCMDTIKPKQINKKNFRLIIVINTCSIKSSYSHRLRHF